MKNQIIFSAILIGAVALPAGAQASTGPAPDDFRGYVDGSASSTMAAPGAATFAKSVGPSRPTYSPTVSNNPSYVDDSFAASAAVVTPEPMSIVLLATGLLGIVGFARTRRKA